MNQVSKKEIAREIDRGLKLKGDDRTLRNLDFRFDDDRKRLAEAVADILVARGIDWST